MGEVKTELLGRRLKFRDNAPMYGSLTTYTLTAMSQRTAKVLAVAFDSEFYFLVEFEDNKDRTTISITQPHSPTCFFDWLD